MKNKIMRLGDRRKNWQTVKYLILKQNKNVVKCSPNPAESPEHRRMKYILYEWCMINSVECATEVTFTNGGRCDFLIRDWALIFEILHSESYTQIKNKNYPLYTIPLPWNYPIEWVHSMLNDLGQIGGKDDGFYLKKMEEYFTK